MSVACIICNPPQMERLQILTQKKTQYAFCPEHNHSEPHALCLRCHSYYEVTPQSLTILLGDHRYGQFPEMSMGLTVLHDGYCAICSGKDRYLNDDVFVFSVRNTIFSPSGYIH